MCVWGGVSCVNRAPLVAVSVLTREGVLVHATARLWSPLVPLVAKESLGMDASILEL